MSDQQSFTAYVFDAFNANDPVIIEAFQRYRRIYHDQVPSVVVYVNEDTPDSDRYEVGVIIFHAHSAVTINN